MMTDQIADMLTRIRNAQAAKKAEVEIPFSRLKFQIAKILEEKGVVEDVIYTKAEKGKQPARSGEDLFTIKIKYIGDKPVIESLKRISKPGLRVYKGKDEIGNVRFGYGFSILSTSQGIMTNEDARQKGIGGEVLCEIY